ncbi:ERO1-like protein alpha [Nematocida homosporus]|uniref:ERO1-like protein alpha n=1 Tax=Nematocida homosporus TaxID=1912981 RepID=UPI00221FD651|nr:ERO1-like protein alpha [Nematocida homosporus]KAI5187568.1 ERO1-like protein alpha [Nematocida homosporus]
MTHTLYFGWILVLMGGVFGATVYYDNLRARELIAALCSNDKFSKTNVPISYVCPSTIRSQLASCGPHCQLSDSEGRSSNGLDNFQADVGEHFTLFEEASQKQMYISLDLKKIIERYTGYKEGWVVWGKMYEVVRDDPVLRMAVSGVHCSVTIHKCAFYNVDPSSRKLFMNYAMMGQQVRPEYLHNLKSTLDLLLSLLPQCIGYMEMVAQGDPGAMILCQELRRALPDVRYNYDQYPVDQRTVERAEALSDLIGCVRCMRCKVWGKVQFEGLKCAILLMLQSRNEQARVSATDIVYLVNLINKMSTAAIQFNRYLAQVLEKKANQVRKQEKIRAIVDGTYSALSVPLLFPRKDLVKRRH